VPWECKAGSTLYIPSGPAGNHLFVILNDPADFKIFPSQSCVLVNFSTVRKAPYDKTVVVDAGVHPFLKDKSYVRYRSVKCERAADLEKRVQLLLLAAGQPVSEELLKRIKEGFYQSDQTPRDFKELKL